MPPVRNAPLIEVDSFVDFVAIYILLFACLLGFPTCFIFLYLFILPYLLPYLHFPLRTGPLRFRAEGRKRPPNLGLSCLSLF